MEYRVEELAAAADLSVDTIRYYQKIGLLDPPERRGRIGVYAQRHRERLAEIHELSARGFTLAQIARLARHPDDRLLDALRAGSDDDTVERAELARLADISDELVDLAIDAGLVRPRSTDPERFGGDAVEMLRAAATILSAGLPIDDLVPLAVEHAGHIEALVEAAIDVFARSLPDDADPAATIATLVPAVTELVAQHFRHTLVDRATARLRDIEPAEATS